MIRSRIERVNAKRKELGIGQLFITDPAAFTYLSGEAFFSGERMVGLLLQDDAQPIVLINELFTLQDTDGVIVYTHSDTDDPMAQLAALLKDNTVLGVDKNMTAGFLLKLMEHWNGKIINGSAAVDIVRQLKDADEQQKMIAVSAINDRVIEALICCVSKDKTELELAADCSSLQKQFGCDCDSFSPIIGFGANGADPHHETDESRGKRGDSVILDIGGKLNGYCSDMTRTVFLGEVSEEGRKVYDIVLEANKRGIAAAKPGARFCDVDNAARSYITELGYGPYFTHRTGHSIGTDVHEAGDVSGSNTDVLKAGMCFSVEPGIYLPGKFGVRIEDLVMITEDGCRVLNSADKELRVIPFPEN